MARRTLAGLLRTAAAFKPCGQHASESTRLVQSVSPLSSSASTAVSSAASSGRPVVSTPTPRVPTLVVHGGAWAIPQENTDATLDGIRDATRAGWEVLNAGGSAIDAVEASVRVLEDNPVFDAGRGSVLTDEGKVEMDACIMDGRSLGAGAVASITAARNPISVARAVMESTDHCLVVGAGADRLVESLGCDVAEDEWLVTPAAQEEYERFKSYSSTVSTLFAAGSNSSGNDEPSVPKGMGHDTVGAVAVDIDGNVAAATSTGGVSFVLPHHRSGRDQFKVGASFKTPAPSSHILSDHLWHAWPCGRLAAGGSRVPGGQQPRCFECNWPR